MAKRRVKLKKGRTYDTHDGKKLHIIASKMIGNGDFVWTFKINGEFKGEQPATIVYKEIYGK